MRVQLSRSGVLKISGIRPVGDNKWSSFQKDFPLSPNCDTNKISAKFEGGILYVRQPKLIVPAEKEETKTPPSETPQPHQTATNDPPPAQKIDQEQAATTQNKTTPSSDEQTKQTSDEDSSSQPSAQEKEAKLSTKEEEEKVGSIRDDDQKAAATTTSDKSEKASGNIDADQPANKGTTNGNGTAKAGDYELNVGSAAARLRRARQMMILTLAVLFTFALGIYVSKMAWFSRKAEE